MTSAPENHAGKADLTAYRIDEPARPLGAKRAALQLRRQSAPVAAEAKAQRSGTGERTLASKDATALAVQSSQDPRIRSAPSPKAKGKGKSVSSLIALL